jgi:transcriptional regulator with XRE-family HTH domain
MGRPRRETSKNLQQAKLLANRIKALRNRRNLTQEKLAQNAGLSVYTISRLERGEKVDPSVFTVDALAQALDTTVDGLLHSPRGVPKSVRQETPAKSKHHAVTDAGPPPTKSKLLPPAPTSATKARRQRSPKQPEG